MFQINKNSHLVTLSTDLKLNGLQTQLLQEGLYLGYTPLGNDQHPVSHYLNLRTTNLYHFKYGSLSNLVSSATIRLNNGKCFHLKDAPRSAIGPDFNRMVIGSNETLGALRSVTFKLTSVPEIIMQGIVPVKSKSMARDFIKTMIGQFIPPLYFYHLDLESSVKFFKELKIKSKPSEVLLFGLSGLVEMVRVSQIILDEYCQKNNLKLHWMNKKNEHETFNHFLHSKKSYKAIEAQYKSLFWQTSSPLDQNKWQKEFIKNGQHHV